MTYSGLIKRICFLEGKIKETEIANVREVMKCLKTICRSEPKAFLALIRYIWE